MKKLYFMAVAAIAALSSCTSDNELELNQHTGKEALTFTATMEDSEATRATYDSENKYALWEDGDQISINGVSYSAREAGTTSTFTADDEGATGETYYAYFPADLYDGTTATLPAIQTYEAGKFNMPMYATNTTTELQFYNLCAVLAIKVTSADITTLKSIKVASDKKMNGTFTVTDNAAVVGTDGTNAVVLESSKALTLTANGTTFYIAIPAQEYAYLNIFLSADGETYTQAMATKKVNGLGEIGRSKIFNIDYKKNATKLWEGNLFIADCNVGATLENVYGGYYAWGGSQNKVDDHNRGTVNLTGEYDTATNLWGSNWRMPKSDELETLQDLGAWNSNGLLCESPDYENNTIFLPAAGYCRGGNVSGQGNDGYYWSSTPIGNNTANYLFFKSGSQHVGSFHRGSGYSVRAVLDETPAAPATKGTAKATIGEESVDVNWVQLWENGPKFAEKNVGATSATDQGTTMTFTDAVETGADYVWGANWRTPSKDDLEHLMTAAKDQNDEKVTCSYVQESGVWGFKFTGLETGYTSNSVFFPAQFGNSDYGGAYYRSGTADGSKAWVMALDYYYDGWRSGWDSLPQDGYCLVRPVLK